MEKTTKIEIIYRNIKINEEEESVDEEKYKLNLTEGSEDTEILKLETTTKVATEPLVNKKDSGAAPLVSYTQSLGFICVKCCVLAIVNGK